MKLITKQQEKSLPNIGETSGPDALARVKVYTPWAGWTWYISEYNPETGECFGVVDSPLEQTTTLGYFSLVELAEIQGPVGLKIERDKHFKTMRIGDISKR